MVAGKTTTLKEVGETLAFIVERMATKEDLKQFATKDDVRAIVEEVVDEKLRPIYASLTEINRRLDTIEQHYANLKGVTKEIDEIRADVREIQKHLGIEKKIAA
jgi:spore coat protein CotH